MFDSRKILKKIKNEFFFLERGERVLLKGKKFSRERVRCELQGNIGIFGGVLNINKRKYFLSYF